MPSRANLLEQVKLSFTQKQSLWRYLSNYITPERKALFERIANQRTYYLSIAIEDIYQERNASAVVRSAECFGIQRVHIIENYHTYRLAKGIAKGADKWVDIHIHDQKDQNNTANCLQQLRAAGYRLVAASPHKNDCLIHELPLDQPMAFIMGGEKQGISTTAMHMAEAFVKIPIYGFTESYNISVAAAIILYECSQRLRQSNIPWRLSREQQLDKCIQWALKSLKKSQQILHQFFEQPNS